MTKLVKNDNTIKGKVKSCDWNLAKRFLQGTERAEKKKPCLALIINLFLCCVSFQMCFRQRRNLEPLGAKVFN